MSDWSSIAYIYDGSFSGLLCCVFESYTCHEIPCKIMSADEAEIVLFDTKEIITEPDKSDRVYKSIAAKMGKEAEELVETAFLYGGDEKSIVIYRFICLGYKYGKKVSDMLGNETVSAIRNMVRAVLNERHHMLEFLRFSEYNGSLVAQIEPKHFVLPILERHFTSRFPEEQFLIYDKTFKMALVYVNHKAAIVELDNLELPPAEEEELMFRRLWTGYYDTIAIKERYNPKCRMGHMPKRFWKYMTEMHAENKTQALPGKSVKALEAEVNKR